jgi:hypothetical protein
MRKNKLSVWTFSYNKRYYLTHPWKWFKDLYWNWRNFWHRARFGYAYVDVWNFCDWYPRVGAEALRYLAQHHSGYPGIKPWENPKEWEEYLNYLANRLERCADSQDICFGEERNEYAEQLDEIMKNRRKVEEHEDGSVTVSHTLTAEEEEIRKKYWAREEEIRKADQEYNKETYKWLAEDLGHFWD